MRKQWFWFKLSIGLSVLLGFLEPRLAICADIKWKTQAFMHVSENQPIDEFLRELFLSQDAVLSISDAVKGQTVSGRFDDSPKKVFKQIADAFDLITYFDGNIFYVLRSNEISSRIISLKNISTSRFRKILLKLNVPDARFPIRFHEREGIVHVFGPAPYIALVEETAKLMDTPDKADDLADNFKNLNTMRVFRLKNAWAEDQYLSVNGRNVRIQGVVSILQDLVEGKSDSVQAEPPADNEQPPAESPVDKLVNVNLKKGLANPLRDAENLLSQMPSRKPARKGDSKVVVQAAERLNAVVIKDSYLNMPYYQMLIDQLDVPLQLVEIKATIVDISSDAIKNLGVDWRGQIRDGDSRYTGSSQTIIKNGNPWLNSIGSTAGGLTLGTILGRFADNYFLARINAMESQGKAKIVSRPSVITFDNIEAQFKHTDTFFVRVAAERDASLYEISTGIVLKVTPHVINENDRTKIQLIVNIEDGMVTDKTVDSIPVLKNSKINTQAIVDENNSLLIGGLMHEQQQIVKNKVPVLGDIPLLGAMFRSKEDTKSKMERLFLISPRIIETSSAEAENGADNTLKGSPRPDRSGMVAKAQSGEERPRPPEPAVVNSRMVLFTLNI